MYVEKLQVLWSECVNIVYCGVKHENNGVGTYENIFYKFHKNPIFL